MAGKPQAEKAVERFPELGCFAVAVRRIVYEKGMTLDNAIRKAESVNPLGLPEWPEAGESRRVCRALHPFSPLRTVSESRPRS